MVTTHIKLVEWVIYDHIKVNENIFGFGFEDLYQEGCIWLCRAAATYDNTSSQFKTYAKVVVRNGLFSYCKRMCNIQKRIINHHDLPMDREGSDCETFESRIPAEDSYEDLISSMDVMGLLESAQSRYKGVTWQGIEALKLKTLGYTGADIANLWGVKQNHLGSWISRAKSKLLKDEQFMMGLKHTSEHELPRAC